MTGFPIGMMLATEWLELTCYSQQLYDKLDDKQEWQSWISEEVFGSLYRKAYKGGCIELNPTITDPVSRDVYEKMHSGRPRERGFSEPEWIYLDRLLAKYIERSRSL